MSKAPEWFVRVLKEHRNWIELKGFGDPMQVILHPFDYDDLLVWAYPHIDPLEKREARFYGMNWRKSDVATVGLPIIGRVC